MRLQLIILRSSTTNETQSPFLRLPAEIRCRIYDYLYGSNTIHVSPLYKKKPRYQLCICKCPDELDSVSSQPVIRARGPYDDGDKRLSHDMERHRDCLFTHPQKSTTNSVSVDFLQVSRQIYHEAALKPFSQISFNYVSATFGIDNIYGLRAFLDALNPTQVRAVANFRLAIGPDAYLNHHTFARLSGLEHLHIDMSLQHWHWYTALARSKGVDTGSWFNEVGNLRLKSLKLSCDVVCSSSRPSKADEASLKDWLELARTRLLRQ